MSATFRECLAVQLCNSQKKLTKPLLQLDMSCCTPPDMHAGGEKLFTDIHRYGSNNTRRKQAEAQTFSPIGCSLHASPQRKEALPFFHISGHPLLNITLFRKSEREHKKPTSITTHTTTRKIVPIVRMRIHGHPSSLNSFR